MFLFVLHISCCSCVAVIVADTACSSSVACAIKELAANKCSYGREAMQATYNAVNLATHVMGVLVSTLCGCVHVASQSQCVLGTIPYTCVYPYNVYSKMFSASGQLWESTKAATKSCIIHGDPVIAP